METEKHASSLEERVKKGVEILDQVHPAWWRTIRIPILNIRQCDACVLGQAFASYSHGLNSMFDEVMPRNTKEDPEEWAIDCGWEVDVEGLADIENAIDDDDGVPNLAHADYDELGVLWAAVVQKRQDAAEL